jgi:hypothetical protein
MNFKSFFKKLGGAFDKALEVSCNLLKMLALIIFILLMLDTGFNINDMIRDGVVIHHNHHIFMHQDQNYYQQEPDSYEEPNKNPKFNI